ncbi:MAG: FAD-binding protein, partial [Alphaproteobacteria bacterium]|nr:FAD-binding protein [Alphaproteobacteria bacterium]
AVVLATGGVGHVYLKTTNPTESYGEGLAMAARAGAMLSDLEFVQFHPTAINIDKDPLPLATEALRGEGSVVIDESGKRFLSSLPNAELSARDIVARGISKQILKGEKVFLDCRKAVGKHFPTRFPTVYGYCKDAGINPIKELIPVIPVAHYHMGGVAVNIHGKTSLENLWACGEVASTGVHGANRLASNSLLEAAVFAKRVAKDIAKNVSVLEKFDCPAETVGKSINSEASACEKMIRKTMYNNFGIIKNRKKMLEALFELEKLKPDTLREKNMLLTARMIALFSLKRQESRGVHFREDYPIKNSIPKRAFMTLPEIETFRKSLN